MVNGESLPVDVCVVCALAEEAQAFLEVVSEDQQTSFKERISPRYGYDYRLATFQNKSGEPLILHVSWLPQYGPQEMALHLPHVLEEFRPRFAAMTGICAGDKRRVALGDLIVAERTFTFDAGSIEMDEEGQHVHRHDTQTYQPDENILRFVHMFEQWKPLVAQLARPPSKRQQRDWLLNRLLDEQTPSVAKIPQAELEEHAPVWRRIVHELQQGTAPLLSPAMQLREPERIRQLRYGVVPFPYTDSSAASRLIKPMASGSAVHRDDPFADVQIPVRGAVAIDMEGAAFGRTMASFPHTRWLVVKDVSDYADSDKDDSYHRYASSASARYLLSFIKSYVTHERLPPLPEQGRNILSKGQFLPEDRPEKLSSDVVTSATKNAAIPTNFDPRRIYAVVVGIEKYQLGKELDGPAQNARRFADWLTAQGVPHNNIALFLSPLERNLQLSRESWPGQYRGSAKRSRIDNVIHQWLPQRSGDLLYVFWEGYSIITSEKNQGLLYADSTKTDWHHLDLESLLTYLQSDNLSGFQKQISIIDTGTVLQPELSPNLTDGGVTFPAGRPLSTRQQFVFIASQEEEARIQSSKKNAMGTFSRNFFEELKSGPSPRLSPDLEALAQRMEKRLGKLREEGIIDQEQVEFRLRKWDGGTTGDALDHSPSQSSAPGSISQPERAHFGGQLRRWRLKARKSSRAIAHWMGVSDAIVLGWESGEIVPSVTHVKKIIEEYLRRKTFKEDEKRQEIERLWDAARLADVSLDIPLDTAWLNALLDAQARRDNLQEKNRTAARNDIEQSIASLTARIGEPPIQQRIRRFLEAYLGNNAHPIPFGGRGSELKFLDDWLDHQQQPYFLLAGPAGRGKSALLVHWCQRMVMQQNVVILFVPVSIRFNTNLASVVFPTIATRLEILHNLKKTDPRNTSIETWRSLMADYLTRPLPGGRRLVLVLDGVDEAADWEIGADLFPYTLAYGTRVILSARTEADRDSVQAWLHSLGWDHSELASMLDLGPLTPLGIADVLRRAGIPLTTPDTGQSLIDRMRLLTEGDPLLIHLYIDDLQAHGKTPASLLLQDLFTIQPRLEGYFQRWWEDHLRLWGANARWNEPAVQAIFDILACALGPVNKDALFRLTPSDIHLTTRNFSDALLPLKRLVSGNGRQGYVFNHFRLGLFFYEKLSNQERQSIEARFLQWGEETVAALNEGKLRPNRANPYIVQYYGPHLERAEANENAFFALISNGWRKAWEAFEGLYAGFLNDVGRAWKMAEKVNSLALRKAGGAPYLDIEVLCAFCQASVVSWQSSTPITLFVACIKNGLVKAELGITYAQQLPDQEEKGKVLARLIEYLPEQRRAPLAREVLEMIQQMRNEGPQAELLSMIAPYLSGSDLQEGLTTAQTLGNQRLQAEISLIPYLPEPLKNEVLQETLEMAQSMYHTTRDLPGALQLKIALVHALAELSSNVADPLKESLLHDALEIAQNILQHAMPGQTQYYDEQVQALIGLAPHLSEKQLFEVMKLAQALQSVRYHLVCAHVARYLSPDAKREVVQQVLLACQEKIKDKSILARILIALIPATDEGSCRDALELAESIPDEVHMVPVLLMVLRHMFRELHENIAPRIIKIVRRLNAPHIRAKALIELISYLDSERETIIQEAYSAAKEMKNKVEQAETLIKLASHMQEDHQGPTVQEAFAMVQNIGDEQFQAHFIAAIAYYAPEIMKNTLWQRAVGLVQAIQVNKLRWQALVDISVYLPEPLRGEILQEMLREMGETQDEIDWVQIFISLAPDIPEACQQEALNMTNNIKSKLPRHQALTELLRLLPAQLRNALALEILADIRADEDERSQTLVMSRLALYADEPVILELEQIAQKMQNAKYKTQALTALIPRLPVTMRTQITRDALASMRMIAQHLVEEGFVIQTLTALAPYDNTENLLTEAVERAETIKRPNSQVNALVNLLVSPVSMTTKNSIVSRLVSMIDSAGPESQRMALKALRPILMEYQPERLFLLWQKILHALGKKTRRDLLVGLSMLAPIVFKLGNENTMIEISKYLGLVSEWWQ